jgi:ABC-type bacteriocin/lantibiotic exporter with double-glycine peptidase domain
VLESQSNVGRTRTLLGRKTLRRTVVLTVSKAITSLFDVLGVGLLGVFSSQIVTTARDGVGTAGQIPFLGRIGVLTWAPITVLFLAISCFLAKSVFSFVLSRAISEVLLTRSAELIKENALLLSHTERMMQDDYESQRLHYLATQATKAASYGIAFPLTSIVVDGFQLVAFVAFLLLTDPIVTIIAIFTIGSVSWKLHSTIATRQYRNGQLIGSRAIASISMFQGLVHGFRELYVSGRLGRQVGHFSQIEADLIDVQKGQNTLSIVPRHVLESVMMVLLAGIAAVVNARSNSTESLVLITVFAATTARILPSLVPMQVGLGEIRANLGAAADFTEFLERLARADVIVDRAAPNFEELQMKVSSLRLSSVSYRYTSAVVDALGGISLEIAGPGWWTLSGPSGSGKSTLLDLVAGVRTPDSGFIKINGINNRDFLGRYAGSVAYVPQRPTFVSASILENVAFGLREHEIDADRVRELLELVGLSDLVSAREGDLRSHIGELGSKFSGGQNQRFAVARALYSQPSLLLIDEATSALDRASEQQMLEIFRAYARENTILSISHNPDSTAAADHRIHMRSGVIDFID